MISTRDEVGYEGEGREKEDKKDDGGENERKIKR